MLLLLNRAARPETITIEIGHPSHARLALAHIIDQGGKCRSVVRSQHFEIDGHVPDAFSAIVILLGDHLELNVVGDVISIGDRQGNFRIVAPGFGKLHPLEYQGHGDIDARDPGEVAIRGEDRARSHHQHLAGGSVDDRR